MRIARRLLPAALSALLPAAAGAVAGDVEYGAYLASECTTCHQADGSSQGLPAITGWPPEVFVQVMQAYRDGRLPHDGMKTIARRLGDEEIAALAAYFATVPAGHD